jgi:hypothetical protein
MMTKLYSIFITLFLFSTLILDAQTLSVGGVTYSVDTLENHQVGPSTQYVSLRLTAPAKRLDVFFLKSDLKNPNIEIRTALGRDSIYTGEPVSSVAKRKSTENNFYFSGVNGDFYATALPYVGYPVSGNMVDGQIAKIPGSRNVFVLDDKKIPDIGIATFSGTVKFGSETWSINSANHLRAENKMVLYNQLNGKYTRTNSYGTEVLIELLDDYTWGTNNTLKAKVVKIEKNIGSMAIPKGKAVLSGNGTAATNLNKLAVDDVIDVRMNLILNNNTTPNHIQMTGGDNYKTMLLNGVVETSSVWNEQHPRTGLGYSQNKDTLVMCVVDGRGVSNGVTTLQLAEIMKSGGAWTAFNMDGGGSSTMYVAEYGKAVNKVSDGTERAVSNGVYIVSTAPTDNAIGMIKPYKSSVLLPRFGEFTPQFYGYNQYGVLLNSDLQNVVLTCPPSLGTIVGNKFIATGTTQGNITATYNGSVVATISVSFLPVSKIEIRLDSVIVDNRSTYPIEVLATTSSGKNLISPQALTWTVDDNSVCKVEDGAVVALKNGITNITGEINSVVDNIQINVELPADATMVGNDFGKGWSVSASSFLNAQLNQENLPQTWNHGAAVNFVHAAGRSPFIKLTGNPQFYGLPDTIKLVMNIGGMEITRGILTFKSNLGVAATTEFNSFTKNSDFSLDVPVNSIYDVTDRGIYPIWFDNVNFYLDASNMVAGQPYTMALKEFTLCYKGVDVTKTLTEKEDLFEIYPNPVVNGELFIKLNDKDFSSLNVKIFNGVGQEVYSKKASADMSGLLKVSIAGFSKGNYLIQLNQNGQSDSVKLIIK